MIPRTASQQYLFWGMSSETRPFSRHKKFLTIAGMVCLAMLLCACGEPPPVVEPEPPTIQKQLPVDFVVCIDNSRSIRAPERILIREITMLLADLAEKDDRISVIIFGESAHVVTSTTVQGDQDKIDFKARVRREVHFDENYSDIRAGMRVLADNLNTITRPGEAVTSVIVLSDGRLEPSDHRTADAFEEMKGILRGPLQELNRNAVVLGDSHCNAEIMPKTMPGLDGKSLMANQIAGSPEYFFHAKSLDQLLEIAVFILNKAKGITSLADKKDKTRFRADRSVESMTLIVRKRSSSGTALCQSSDIQLNTPEGVSAREDESIYRSSDYRYFELILVQNPRVGDWSVSLTNGQRPEVFSKIVSPLELRFEAKKKYYLNESSYLKAWIFDRNTSQVVKETPFKIEAWMTSSDTVDDSSPVVELRSIPVTGQYLLPIPSKLPDRFTETAAREEKPLHVTIELVAKQLPTEEQQDYDPWFARRSPPIPVDLSRPFLEWLHDFPPILKIPFAGTWVHKEANIGLRVDTASPVYPDFVGLPMATFRLEKLDKDTGAYVPYKEEGPELLQGVKQDKEIAYLRQMETGSLDSGVYRYSYRLSGATESAGLFELTSPYFSARVRTLWEVLLVLALVLFLVLSVLCSLAARLKGYVRIHDQGAEEEIRLPGVREYVSPGGYDNMFKIKAVRHFCLIRRVRLTVLKGEVAANETRNQKAGESSTWKVGALKSVLCEEESPLRTVEIELQIFV